MSKLESFSYNLLYHYSSLVMNIITGIFMVPLYLKFINIEIYGYWIAISGIISFLSLIDPGFGTVIQQKTSEAYVKNKSQIGEYILSGLLLTSFISLFILLIFYSFGSIIIKYVNIDIILFKKELFYPFFIALISMILMLYGYIFNAVNIAIFNTKNITKLNLSTTFITIFITILLLFNSFKIYAIAITMFIRALVFMYSNYIFLKKRMSVEKIQFHYNNDKTKELLNFSSFTFLGRLSSTITLQLATMVVAFYLSPILAVSMKMTQIIPETLKMLFDRPTYALTPVLVNKYNQNPENIFLKNFINFYLKILIFFASIYFLLFYVINEVVVKIWIGDKFAGNEFNLFFLLYLFFSIINQSANYLVYGFGDLKRSNIILFFQSILFSILLYLFARKFSIIGVAIAYLIPEFFIVFLYSPLKLLKLVKSSNSNIYAFFKFTAFSLLYLLFYVFFFESDIINLNSTINRTIYFCFGSIFYAFFIYVFSGEFKNLINFIYINGLNNSIKKFKNNII